VHKQLSNSNKTDSDNDEKDPGMLDVKISQLLNSDIDDEFKWICERLIRLMYENKHSMTVH